MTKTLALLLKTSPLTSLLSVIVIAVGVWGMDRMYAMNDAFLAAQCAKGIPSKELCGGSYGGEAQRSNVGKEKVRR
ncbi:hypothetical protein [Burkholderia gladioli]|uniref:hypothetical protein n=1 Tax=Burkholderia gladioli TaxID=28095 RepID=UPI001C5D73AD|nr:hypothetical protein [Burkholderia gladioli]MBW5284130.1 hypothetical protein [Burkholderia gladioli]